MNILGKFKINHRRIFVDRFQLRLVGVACIHFLIVVVLFAVALFAPTIIALERGELGDPEVLAAARTYLVLHNSVWLPLLGAFALLILHNVLVTHRVAGPLMRLRRYLRVVADGNLSTSIEFRTNDYLQEDAIVATDMVKSLAAKVSAIDIEIQEAREVWLEMKGAMASHGGSALEQRISDLDGHLDACRSLVRVFTTGHESNEDFEKAFELLMTSRRVGKDDVDG